MGHLAVLLATPVLSRLYSPEQFGAYGAFVAVLAMASALAGLRYDIAVPVPESDESAARLAVLALSFVGVVAVVAGIVAGAVGWSPGGGEASPWFGVLLAVGLAALGTYQVATAWAVRTRDYRVLSTSRMTRSVAQVVAQIGLGTFGAPGLGLMIGHVVGSFAGMLRMLRALLRFVTPSTLRLRGLLAAAGRYKNYPIYSVPSGLLNAAGNQLPLLIVLAVYGPATAGAFAFTQRVLSAPLTVISQAVGQVFTGEFRSLMHAEPGRAAALYVNTVGRLALAALVPVALLALVAPAAFALVFGQEWEFSGTLARVMAPMLFAQFVALPVSSVLNLLQQTRLQLGYDVGRVILGLSPLIVLTRLGQDPSAAVGGYAIGMVLASLLNIVIGYSVVRRSVPDAGS